MHLFRSWKPCEGVSRATPTVLCNDRSFRIAALPATTRKGQLDHRSPLGALRERMAPARCPRSLSNASMIPVVPTELCNLLIHVFKDGSAHASVRFVPRALAFACGATADVSRRQAGFGELAVHRPEALSSSSARTRVPLTLCHRSGSPIYGFPARAFSRSHHFRRRMDCPRASARVPTQ